MPAKPAKRTIRTSRSVGRPSSPMTEEERALANRRRNHSYQTSAEYKARRRERYETDPDYRAACLARSRAAADAAKAPQAAAYARDVRSALRSRKSLGAKRTVEGSGTEELTFSVPELAGVLCRPVCVLRDWIRAGRFPAPCIKARGPSGPPVMVFSEMQAVCLAEVAIDHLRTASAHLLASHEDTIIALHRAM